MRGSRGDNKHAAEDQQEGGKGLHSRNWGESSIEFHTKVKGDGFKTLRGIPVILKKDGGGGVTPCLCAKCWRGLKGLRTGQEERKKKLEIWEAGNLFEETVDKTCSFIPIFFEAKAG